VGEVSRAPARFTDDCKCGGEVALARPRRYYLMMDRFYAWATALIAESKNDEGQTFVEYALILAVVVVAVLLAVTWTGLGTAIQNAITQVSNAIGA
jgi:Flp pilus assembly pilin Flp